MFLLSASSAAAMAVAVTAAEIGSMLVSQAGVLASLLAPAAVLGSVVGMIPPAGPGRALVLGLRSLFFREPTTLSQRTSEVESLRRMTANARGYEYCIVYGPTGVGEQRASTKHHPPLRAHVQASHASSTQRRAGRLASFAFGSGTAHWRRASYWTSYARWRRRNSALAAARAA